MRVKLFDENHEKDLEKVVNAFLSQIDEVIDIQYQVAIMNDHKTNEQIYCYSAMVIYQE